MSRKIDLLIKHFANKKDDEIIISNMNLEGYTLRIKNVIARNIINEKVEAVDNIVNKGQSAKRIDNSKQNAIYISNLSQYASAIYGRADDHREENEHRDILTMKESRYLSEIKRLKEGKEILQKCNKINKHEKIKKKINKINKLIREYEQKVLEEVIREKEYYEYD